MYIFLALPNVRPPAHDIAGPGISHGVYLTETEFGLLQGIARDYVYLRARDLVSGPEPGQSELAREIRDYGRQQDSAPALLVKLAEQVHELRAQRQEVEKLEMIYAASSDPASYVIGLARYTNSARWGALKQAREKLRQMRDALENFGLS